MKLPSQGTFFTSYSTRTYEFNISNRDEKIFVVVKKRSRFVLPNIDKRARTLKKKTPNTRGLPLFFKFYYYFFLLSLSLCWLPPHSGNRKSFSIFPCVEFFMLPSRQRPPFYTHEQRLINLARDLTRLATNQFEKKRIKGRGKCRFFLWCHHRSGGGAGWNVMLTTEPNMDITRV